MTKQPASRPADRARHFRPARWAAVICLASLALRVPAIVQPSLFLDDFQVLARSWTWHDAWANLWVPANEHSMPLGRLSTWVLVRLAGSLENVPLVFSLQGPIALIAAMVLTYLFVSRETGSPTTGLLAMALFGVSTRYFESVTWFSASFAMLGLDMFLLALLASQRWAAKGRARYLLGSGFWSALAPAWFGSGALAGPLCALYLLAPRRAQQPDRIRGWRRWLIALVPVLGTAASLAISLPNNARRILELPRVETARTAWESFDPWTGLQYSIRVSVDDLLPGAFWPADITAPQWLVWPLFALLILGVASICWKSQARALTVVGPGMILASYLLIFTARAYLPYKEMHSSSRYHLYAHLGLVLILSGWPAVQRIAHRLSGAPVTAAGLLLLLGVTQLPRSGPICYDPQQARDLRRIVQIDALCRQHHIHATTAREVLPFFDVYGCDHREVDGHVISGWDFLEGSDGPAPATEEQARAILTSELP